MGEVRAVPELDPEIRRVICSTNAIESVNARIRRAPQGPRALPPRASRVEVCLPGHHESRPDRHRPQTLDHALETRRNAFEIALEGRLAAGRKWPLGPT
nr:transposase [Kibdelosporangium phytohabitans]